MYDPDAILNISEIFEAADKAHVNRSSETNQHEIL